MMIDQPARNEPTIEEEEGPAMVRRPMKDTADLDITPMIDITFLLLIFFLVCSTAAMQTSVELPPAQFGEGVSEKTSVIFTVVAAGESGRAEVYLGSATGARLPDDPAAQEKAIAQAVEEGFRQGNSSVLVKAERKVKCSEVLRVAAAAGQVEGISLHYAVMEIE